MEIKVVSSQSKITFQSNRYLTCIRRAIGLHHCEKNVSTPSLTCGELNGGVFTVKANGAIKDLQASFNKSWKAGRGPESLTA